MPHHITTRNPSTIPTTQLRQKMKELLSGSAVEERQELSRKEKKSCVRRFFFDLIDPNPEEALVIASLDDLKSSTVDEGAKNYIDKLKQQYTEARTLYGELAYASFKVLPHLLKKMDFESLSRHEDVDRFMQECRDALKKHILMLQTDNSSLDVKCGLYKDLLDVSGQIFEIKMAEYPSCELNSALFKFFVEARSLYGADILSLIQLPHLLLNLDVLALTNPNSQQEFFESLRSSLRQLVQYLNMQDGCNPRFDTFHQVLSLAWTIFKDKMGAAHLLRDESYFIVCRQLDYLNMFDGEKPLCSLPLEHEANCHLAALQCSGYDLETRVARFLRVGFRRLVQRAENKERALEIIDRMILKLAPGYDFTTDGKMNPEQAIAYRLYFRVLTEFPPQSTTIASQDAEHVMFLERIERDYTMEKLISPHIYELFDEAEAEAECKTSSFPDASGLQSEYPALSYHYVQVLYLRLSQQVSRVSQLKGSQDINAQKEHEEVLSVLKEYAQDIIYFTERVALKHLRDDFRVYSRLMYYWLNARTALAKSKLAIERDADGALEILKGRPSSHENFFIEGQNPAWHIEAMREGAPEESEYRDMHPKQLYYIACIYAHKGEWNEAKEALYVCLDKLRVLIVDLIPFHVQKTSATLEREIKTIPSTYRDPGPSRLPIVYRHENDRIIQELDSLTSLYANARVLWFFLKLTERERFSQIDFVRQMCREESNSHGNFSGLLVLAKSMLNPNYSFQYHNTSCQVVKDHEDFRRGMEMVLGVLDTTMRFLYSRIDILASAEEEPLEEAIRTPYDESSLEYPLQLGYFYGQEAIQVSTSVSYKQLRSTGASLETRQRVLDETRQRCLGESPFARAATSSAMTAGFRGSRSVDKPWRRGAQNAGDDREDGVEGPSSRRL